MMSLLGLATAAGSLLLDGVADKVVTTTVDKGSESLKERIGLARDPIKVAFDTALHKAVTDTFKQHPDYDGSLFNATFLKSDSGATLLAKTLTPDDTLTGAELAAAWADRSSATVTGFIPATRDDLVRWMTPVCDTFVVRLRHHLRADRDLLAITQVKDTAGVRRELEQLNTELPRLQQEQAEALATLNSTLLSLFQVLTPLLKEIHATLTRGILPSPEDDTGVQNFLLHYLGWEKQKVPFGGRELDFKKLDEWFYNPYAPQYLLMTAEAGKGKSALLVQWCALMLQRHDHVDVVFMPISIRFNTSSKEVFFSALGTRLSVVHHDQSNYQQMRGEDWQKVCNTYLKREIPEGRQLLVVIDAIDEATGWEANAGFVPLQLPQGVKLVVSGREQAGQDWREQLGWESATIAAEYKVGDLSIGGVRAVLNMMGNPLDRIATDGDVVHELYTLTKGDPLLVRLYVDSLVGQKERLPYLKASDLKMLKPGLKGYFDRWWREQKKLWKASGQNPLEEQKQVEEFFFVVATAHGPLSKEDVLAVTKGISGFGLTDITKAVGRFIIGDGDQRGYAFSHPRLGYYFFDQLGLKEKTAWNQRFVEYGQTFLAEIRYTNRTRWLPNEITPHAYIIQHYATHLQQANAPVEQFYDLICQEWAQAWESLRGTYDGFLGDVEQAANRAEDDPDRTRALTIYVKGTLCRSSIIGLSSNISPDLLVTATRFGVLSQTQAIVLLEQYNSEANKTRAITLFVKHFARDTDFLKRLLDTTRAMISKRSRAKVLVALAPLLTPDEKAFVLQEALEVARAMQDESSRAEVLVALAPLLPQSILEVARTMQDERNRAKVLVALAPLLPLPVLEVARTMRDERNRAEVLVALAPLLPLPVLEVARTMRDESNRAEVLVALAPLLPLPVLEIARAMQDESSRAKVLVALAPLLPQSILEEARAMQDESSRTKVLVALAPLLPQSILEEARAMRNESNRAKVLVALAPLLPLPVLEEARAMQDESSRAKVLAALAPLLTPDEQTLVLEEALEQTRIRDNRIGSRARVLVALAPLLPLPVLEVARTMRDEGFGDRARVLVALAPLLPLPVLEVARTMRDEGFGDRAKVLVALAPLLPLPVLEVARTMQDESSQVEVLVALAPLLPLPVLEMARAMQDERSQVEMLVVLAPLLPPDKQALLLQEALQVARAMRDDRSRAEVLVALALLLTPDEQASILQKALQVARAIRDDRSRAKVLVVLAPLLPLSVLEVARAMRDERSRADVLVALAPLLPQPVLEIARAMWVEWSRAEVLVALAPLLTPDERALVLQETLQETGRRDDILESRAKVLIALASLLTPDKQTPVLQEALEVARAMRGDTLGNQAEVLIALVSLLPQSVLEVARTMWDERNRAEVLLALAPLLPQSVLEVACAMRDEDSRAKVLVALAPLLPQSVLEVARAIQDERSHAEILVFPLVTPDKQDLVLQEIWEVAHTIQDEKYRAQVLVALAPLLTPNEQALVLQEALEVARAMQDESSRADVLVALAPIFPESVLEIACTMQNEASRTKVLVTLAPLLVQRVSSLERMIFSIWLITIRLLSHRPRPEFLLDLHALMPFTLAFANDIPQTQSTSRFTLSDVQTKTLRRLLLDYIDLSTPTRKRMFLEDAGLRTLEGLLRLDDTPTDFAYDLVRLVQDRNRAGDLIRYLKDTATGHADLQAWAADVLGSTPLTPRQQLAQGILDAVQEVCSWWP